MPEHRVTSGHRDGRRFRGHVDPQHLREAGEALGEQAIHLVEEFERGLDVRLDRGAESRKSMDDRPALVGGLKAGDEVGIFANGRFDRTGWYPVQAGLAQQILQAIAKDGHVGPRASQ